MELWSSSNVLGHVSPTGSALDRVQQEQACHATPKMNVMPVADQPTMQKWPPSVQAQSTEDLIAQLRSRFESAFVLLNKNTAQK
jgi:hypothetical protein